MGVASEKWAFAQKFPAPYLLAPPVLKLVYAHDAASLAHGRAKIPRQMEFELELNVRGRAKRPCQLPWESLHPRPPPREPLSPCPPPREPLRPRPPPREPLPPHPPLWESPCS